MVCAILYDFRLRGKICIKPFLGGHDRGEVQTYGWRTTHQTKPPPDKFSDPSRRASGVLSLGFQDRKNRATTPEGGGKRTRRKGVQDLLLGGVSFVLSSPPLLFFAPPLGVSSDVLPQKTFWVFKVR